MLNRDLGLKRFRINRILNENAISRKKRGWGRKNGYCVCSCALRKREGGWGGEVSLKFKQSK